MVVKDEDLVPRDDGVILSTEVGVTVVLAVIDSVLVAKPDFEIAAL